MKRLLTRWAPILAPIIIILTVLSVVALGATVSWIPAQEGIGVPSHTSGLTYQLVRHVDFAVTPAAAATTSYTILTIPMNTYVRAIVTKVTRAEGAEDEFDIAFSNLTAESETVKVNEVSLATINAAAITAIDEIKTTDTLVSINTGTDGALLTVGAVDIWVLCEPLYGATGDED